MKHGIFMIGALNKAVRHYFDHSEDFDYLKRRLSAEFSKAIQSFKHCIS